MTNIKHIAYVDQLCPRCGSKRFTSRRWKEKIATYFGGFAEVEYSQIDCTNKVCQNAFDKTQAEELAKRELLRAKKIDSSRAIKKTRSPNRSRV